jgi:hypothetical protein
VTPGWFSAFSALGTYPIQPSLITPGGHPVSLLRARPRIALGTYPVHFTGA